MVPPQKGRPLPRRVPVMEALVDVPFCHNFLSDAPFGDSLSMYPSKKVPYRRTLQAEKDAHVHFILVLQCFLAFPWPCRCTLWGLRTAFSY